jgi:hypothetical protein
MADSLATKNDITVRKRKTHRKSRLGCGNCKIRSVKVNHALPFPALPRPHRFL